MAFTWTDIFNHITTVVVEHVQELRNAIIALDGRKLDAWGAPDDNENLNASSLRHGLMPKLSGDAAKVYLGDGSQKVLDGWVRIAGTGSYASATSLVISGDYTGLAKNFAKIRFYNNGSYKYGYVYFSAYDNLANKTTITLVSSSSYLIDNASITAVDLSFGLPVDFPSYFNYIPALNGGGAKLSGYSLARYKIEDRRMTIFFISENATLTGSAGSIWITLPSSVSPTTSLWRNNYHAYVSGITTTCPMFVVNAGRLEVYKTGWYGSWDGNETGVYISIDAEMYV